MKPEQLAKRLNITSAAIRKWTGTDFREFFSPSAAGIKGTRRSFDERDARILAWIAQLKEKNTPTHEIQTILRNAAQRNWQDLPPLPREDSASRELSPQLKDVIDLHEQFALVKQERDQLSERLKTVEAENSLLRQRLLDTDAQLLDLNKRLIALLEKERRRK